MALEGSSEPAADVRAFFAGLLGGGQRHIGETSTHLMANVAPLWIVKWGWRVFELSVELAVVVALEASADGSIGDVGHLPVGRRGGYDVCWYCCSQSRGATCLRVLWSLAVLYQVIHLKIVRRASARFAKTRPWRHSRLRGSRGS